MPQETITVGRETLAFRVDSELSGGALLAFDVQMPPGGGPPMLHRHDPFELYRVESGEFSFYVEDDRGTVRRTIARTGSVVPIPGGREHTVRNESDAPARAFVVFSPGGPMESFARGAGALAAGGEPQPSEVLSLAAAHGIEITRALEEVS